MKVKSGYSMGDQVQAHDGRIGIVIDVEEITDGEVGGIIRFLGAQKLVVRFPDQSTMEGTSDHFKAVNARPFGRVASMTC
jgi:hypothetical protein